VLDHEKHQDGLIFMVRIDGDGNVIDGLKNDSVSKPLQLNIVKVESNYLPGA